ncbi:MAG: DUF692 domain-containing protein [Planctomycetes bacterium]|nr:DUF692 domain-containing protein [Planctomycetota bacterium]
MPSRPTPPRPAPPRNRFGLPHLGLGLGLRTVHYEALLATRPAVGFFELLTENYLATDGRPARIAEQFAEQWPLVLHGVSMSLGSADRLDFGYLRQLKQLAERVNAVWLGDHVCFTGVAGRNSHDLLPLPYDEANLRHLVRKVRAAQEFLERPLVLENPSTYVTFGRSTMGEAEFLARLADEADCALLLDVNNVYVSCRNHGWDAADYLAAIPYDRVVQIHLAGHTDHGTHCIDTHSAPVCDPVWQLYAEVERRSGGRSTLLEWDEEIPPLADTLAELQKARRFQASGARRLVRAGAVGSGT